MNAIASAQGNFSRFGASFEQALTRCLLKGIVVSLQNEVMLLAEPGTWDGKNLDTEVYEPKKWNCWFIWWAHGPGVSPLAYVEMAPFVLEYVAFNRRNRGIRVYKLDRVLREKLWVVADKRRLRSRYR